MISEQLEDFLSEYKSLCEKYQTKINSCGCCDSPWIADNQDELDKHIEHLRKEWRRMYHDERTND